MGSLCGIALYYHLKKSETNETYTVLSATVKDKYSKTHIGDIDGRKADGDIKIHHDAGLH